MRQGEECVQGIAHRPDKLGGRSEIG